MKLKEISKIEECTNEDKLIEVLEEIGDKGLGSTLCDVKEKIGNYIQNYDTYELENIKGICFELEDIEDWDQLKAPIDHIYVFMDQLKDEERIC